MMRDSSSLKKRKGVEEVVSALKHHQGNIFNSPSLHNVGSGAPDGQKKPTGHGVTRSLPSQNFPPGHGTGNVEFSAQEKPTEHLILLVGSLQ
jgi:hypothetical protein